MLVIIIVTIIAMLVPLHGTGDLKFRYWNAPAWTRVFSSMFRYNNDTGETLVKEPGLYYIYSQVGPYFSGHYLFHLQLRVLSGNLPECLMLFQLSHKIIIVKNWTQ